jgi:tRNA threonylcarbamoyladenosine biosynthesis protein TsaB
LKILAIDTSSATATVAVMSDGILMGEHILNNGKTHSQKLLIMIEALLKDCGLKPSDIDIFACSSGPGSFTGLRIGAATIKGMAHVLKKPVIGVATLDILAHGLYNCSGLICSVLDAQRETVYSAIYKWENGSLIRLEDLRVISSEALIDYLHTKDTKITLTGDGTYLFKDKIAKADNIAIAPATHLLPRASSCAALAEEMYKAGQTSTYDTFVPQYIRKSQAEVEYEKKQKIDICSMELKDVDQVFEIERLSFATPWSKEAFIEEIEKNKLAKYVVAKDNEMIVAYGGIWFVLDEGHITNIAVHPQYRGQKIGEKIVQSLIKVSRENNINKMTLEVRAANVPARNLYKKLGFDDFGIRKGYYSDTGEDAVIMWKNIN